MGLRWEWSSVGHSRRHAGWAKSQISPERSCPWSLAGVAWTLAPHACGTRRTQAGGPVAQLGGCSVKHGPQAPPSLLSPQQASCARGSVNHGCPPRPSPARALS